jgi:hypothetical protein
MERKMEKAVSISNRSTVSAKNIMLITEFLLFKMNAPNKFNVCKPPKRRKGSTITEKTNMSPCLPESLKHFLVVDFQVNVLWLLRIAFGESIEMPNIRLHSKRQ